MASRPKPHNNEFKNSYALVIGINDYREGITSLRTAVNDAQKLASLLESEHGYEVTLLTSDTGEVSEQRIRTTLTEGFKQVRKHDRFLFYFAGHGIAIEGDDGPEGFIVPQDANQSDRETLLPMTELHQWLTMLPCRHMLAILDCCFAGAIRWSFGRSGGFQGVDVIHKERYARYIRSKAWQVLTSAAHNQEALDVVSGQTVGVRDTTRGEAHSPFANALINGLAGAADLIPKDGGDGVITASELALYLRDEVETEAKEAAAHNQTPMLWKLKQHEHGEFVFVANPDALNLPDAPELDANSSPWKGLQAYTQEDEKRFFGRMAVINELKAKVAEHPLTIVTGASGTGKSSVVMAGLLPQLKQDGVWGEALVETIRPGTTPRTTIVDTATTIQDALQNDGTKRAIVVIDQFEEVVTQGDSDDIEAVLAEMGRMIEIWPERLRLIVTVRTDFEPYFKRDASPLQVQGVWAARRYVVRGMTRDELREVIVSPAEQKVLYFDPETLVDTLADEVVGMPGGLPLLSFTLNQLYAAFFAQYQRDGAQTDRALTGGAYEAIGELSGALQKQIEELYQRLDGYNQATMKRILLRMVAVDGSQSTRRRVRQDELNYPNEKENEQVNDILTQLQAKRLIVMDGDFIELAHDALVTAWDELVVWRREAMKTYLPLQRRVATASYDWQTEQDESKRKGLLWHNSPYLTQLNEEINVISLSKGEEAFVEASGKRRTRNRRNLWSGLTTAFILISIAAIVAFFQADRAQTESDARATEIIVRTTAQAQAVAQSTRAFEQQTIAELERDEAIRQSKLILAQSLADLASDAGDRNNDNELETLLALEAIHIHDEHKGDFEKLVDDSLRATLDQPYYNVQFAGHESGITSVAFSPNGNWFASGSNDRAIRLWSVPDLGSDPIILSDHENLVRTVAFSPDGKWLASGSDDETIRLWSLSNLQSDPIILSDHDDTVWSLAFSQDGEWLASSSEDKTIRLWSMFNLESDPIVITDHNSIARSLAFSQDGAWLSAGSNDQTVWLWPMSDLASPIALSGHDSVVFSVAFSPDGVWLASGGGDQTVRLWSLSNLESDPVTFSSHSSRIQSVAFSADSEWLASGSDDETILLWSLSNFDADPIMLAGHGDDVRSVAFSADGRWLISGSNDQIVRLWSMSERGAEPIILSGHDWQVNSVDFSSDGRWLASASGDETVRVWSLFELETEPIILSDHDDWVQAVAFSADGKWLATGSSDKTVQLQLMSDLEADPITLYGHEDWVNDLAFSHDGQWLASGSKDQTVRLWSMSDLEIAPIVLFGHEKWVSSVTFSADDRWLATGGDDNTIRVWSIADIETDPIIFFGDDHPDYEPHIKSIAFSPDNNMLASGSSDHKVRLWSISNPEIPSVILDGHGGWIRSVEFSPDGDWLASASSDETVWLWSLFDTETDPIILDGHEGQVHSLAFSQDGRWLASGSNDQTVRLWDHEYLTEGVCERRMRRNLSWDEWQLYLPSESYRQTCPNLPVHPSVPEEARPSSDI